MLDHLGRHPTCRRCGHRLSGGTCFDCENVPYGKQWWKSPQSIVDKPQEKPPEEKTEESK